MDILQDTVEQRLVAEDIRQQYADVSKHFWATAAESRDLIDKLELLLRELAEAVEKAK